jgi:hypothetical protein
MRGVADLRLALGAVADPGPEGPLAGTVRSRVLTQEIAPQPEHSDPDAVFRSILALVP